MCVCACACVCVYVRVCACVVMHSIRLCALSNYVYSTSRLAAATVEITGVPGMVE